MALKCTQVPSASVVCILFVKRLMREGRSDRPFSHCGGHPFGIAASDVADREHVWQTGFEEVGHPGKWPMRGCQIL